MQGPEGLESTALGTEAQANSTMTSGWISPKGGLTLIMSY